jgi:hypothetical protein
MSPQELPAAFNVSPAEHTCCCTKRVTTSVCICLVSLFFFWRTSRSTAISYKTEGNQLQQFGSYIIKTTQTHKKHEDNKEDIHGGNSNFPKALLKRPSSSLISLSTWVGVRVAPSEVIRLHSFLDIPSRVHQNGWWWDKTHLFWTDETRHICFVSSVWSPANGLKRKLKHAC